MDRIFRLLSLGGRALLILSIILMWILAMHIIGLVSHHDFSEVLSLIYDHL